MPPGQVLTLATLVLAASVFIGGCVLGWHIAFDTAFLPSLIDRGFAAESARSGSGTFGALTAFLGFGLAAALVKSQQAVSGWFMKRHLDALRATYREIEDALGTDAAERWLVYKSERLRQAAGGALGIFG